MLMKSVMDDILTQTESPMIERATILKDGNLTSTFSYLKDCLTPDA
jgi:hypothetical protein